MSAKRRSLSELVEQGRAQSVVPTSALLDPSSMLASATPAVEIAAVDEHSVGEGSGLTPETLADETGRSEAADAELVDHEPVVPRDVADASNREGSDAVPVPVPEDGGDTAVHPPISAPAPREGGTRRGAAKRARDDEPRGVEAVLALLPDAHEVLRTGVRRTEQPVRDVTYELPSAAYFSLNRLKNDLARAGGRRVTVPAIVEAALSRVPDTPEAVLELLGRYDTAGLLRSGPQRRLSARIGEDRYQALRDLALELYERTGDRVPSSEIWTLAIVLLLELADRWPPG